MLLVQRAPCRIALSKKPLGSLLRSQYSSSAAGTSDPRLGDLGKVIQDEYAQIREKYQKPKYPIVLAHGLLGFDELHLAGRSLPGVQYWRGIREAFKVNGIEVMSATAPAAGSIEERAAKLGESIHRLARGKSVNIIAHSMWTRCKIYDQPPEALYVDVRSLTTIATPHRGSAFADYMFKQIGPINIPKLYNILESFGLETGAFSQLTMEYMRNDFNPKTPDVEGIRFVLSLRHYVRGSIALTLARYFSYGASLEPTFWSVFRPSFNIIKEAENAPNDGLVSVPSSQWGEYRGTLVGVSHLDLINWTNRLKWFFWELTGSKRNFNAIAFYLAITDMLAKEGL
ncbi:putative triacylglycerol lipase [Pseudovirgaria hyperparasitica]|uniref:Putative triacylglycerol lipase n=1 Tax=Pseudovirgaria hyperparasitica TaxID=470096 RepID=A0A6A6VVA8_9PEZI|nr:putative triacylglycerol lipase [Pseudovirgaria hyperparasitica]KAF2753181.1 putative triacylglycerol lipase [Pseudovirgaria hyperparasitica]